MGTGNRIQGWPKIPMGLFRRHISLSSWKFSEDSASRKMLSQCGYQFSPSLYLCLPLTYQWPSTEYSERHLPPSSLDDFSLLTHHRLHISMLLLTRKVLIVSSVGSLSSYLQLLGTVLAERSLIAATALSSEGRNGPLIIRLRRGPITCFPDGNRESLAYRCIASCGS